jgi:hypothetical protein
MVSPNRVFVKKSPQTVLIESDLPVMVIVTPVSSKHMSVGVTETVTTGVSPAQIIFG